MNFCGIIVKMSNDTVAVLQLAAAIIVMAANVLLAIFTYRYVRLTAGMLEHMRGAQAAAIVIDLTFDGHSAYLNIENAGNTAATNIVFDELSGLGWSEHAAIDELRRRGISYLPAHRTMRFWLGFPDWDKVKQESAPVRVALSYNAEGSTYRRDFVIDMMQYSGTTTQSAPEDRIVNAIERLRDAQRDRGLFGRMGMFRPPKKACGMCAESIPAAAKICSHCGSVQPSTPSSSDTAELSDDTSSGEGAGEILEPDGNARGEEGAVAELRAEQNESPTERRESGDA